MYKSTIETLLADFAQPHSQKKAVDSLFEYLYFNLGEYGIYCTNEDMRSDFLLWLYPKLTDIIAGYKPDRSLFSTYMRMTVSYNWKLFLRKNQEKTTFSAIVQDDQSLKVKHSQDEQQALASYEQYAASSIPAYTVALDTQKAIEKTIKWKVRGKDMYRRYFLELLCKSCFCIDEQMLRAVAGHVHMSVDTARAFVESSKVLAGQKETRFHILLAQRDFYYVRYKSAALQLEKIDHTHASVVKRLKKQKAYSYQLWQRSLKRIHEYSCGPSNRALAKQLGISRSTIDSDLETLKNVCLYE